MNLFLISLFDPTPLDEPIYPRFIGIAKAAVKRGHKVTHFTSTFRHTTKEHRFTKSKDYKESDNYKIVFTHSMGYKNNRMPRRFIAHWHYTYKLIHELKRRKKPDIIFVSMPPLSNISKVSKWAEKYGIPVVADIIDPWPDSFIKDLSNSFKVVGETLLFPFYKLLERALNRCSAITSISNGYLDWVSDYHKSDMKTSPFFLAIDFEEVQQKITQMLNGTRYEAEKPLRIIYAGSLASSYDIPTILKAARYFDEKYPVRTKFIITGKGPQAERIKQVQENLENIEYLGWVSRDELLNQYGLADLGLIQHKNSLTQTITYKFFNYMSGGLPLLNSLQGEMADMIGQHNLGFNNEEQNVDQLTQNIEFYLDDSQLLNQHKQNALRFTSKYGNSKVVYNNLINFLAKIEEEKRGN